MYEYDKRCDSNLSDSDLMRLQKEADHNVKKQEWQRKNVERGLREDGRPIYRQADNNVQEQLIGNGADFEQAGANNGANRNQVRN